jgi:translation initiation factor 6
MALNVLDIYRSSNIGIFAKTNDEFVILPSGLAESKADKIASMLSVTAIKTSIAGSRLIGPLVAMNNQGILVSRLAETNEVGKLAKETGLSVTPLASRYTSVGNLVAANDKGAIVSEMFSEETVSEIRRGLKVPVRRLSVASFHQVGALVSATNQGAIAHPRATEEEVMTLAEVLGVEVEAATVNGGVPFVSSGVLPNERNVLAGNLTTGPELAILGRAFKV